MKTTILFKFERETKGAVRYMEVTSNGEQVKGPELVIGTLYIRKTALTGKIPSNLKVSLEGA